MLDSISFWLGLNCEIIENEFELLRVYIYINGNTTLCTRYTTKKRVKPGEWEYLKVVVKVNCLRLGLINRGTVRQKNEHKTSTASLYLNQVAHSSEWIDKFVVLSLVFDHLTHRFYNKGASRGELVVPIVLYCFFLCKRTCNQVYSRQRYISSCIFHST